MPILLLGVFDRPPQSSIDSRFLKIVKIFSKILFDPEHIYIVFPTHHF